MARFPLAATAKLNMLNTLTTYLYKPWEENNQAQIDKIVLAHVEASKATQLAFRYRGEVYTSEKVPYRPPVSTLHPSLHAQIQEFLKQREDVLLYERPLITNSLSAIFNLSNHPNDFLKVLPEELHYPLAKFYGNKESFNAFDEELSKEQVEAAKEKFASAIEAIRVRLVTNLVLR